MGGRRSSHDPYSLASTAVGRRLLVRTDHRKVSVIGSPHGPCIHKVTVLSHLQTCTHSDFIQQVLRRLHMGACTEVRGGPHLTCWVVLSTFIVHTVAVQSNIKVSARNNSSRGLFAPRLEYDEWTPLGHGDPLKNDPTYDYVPPVLERVRYWLEPPSRSPPPRPTPPTPTHHNHPTNTHTTFIQTTSFDSRRDTYPFLTLVDAPKFNHHIKTPPPPSHYLPRPHFSVPPPPYRTIPPATPPPQVLTPAPSVPPTTTVTTPASALTTDPLFAHYKQPAEPLRGPMYLIIEGHSKVKTYGASKTIHGIRVHDDRRQKRTRRRRKSRSILNL